MSLVFSIPGKTFLAGEYLVLQEGPALVFLSEPRFELEAKKGSGDVLGIHPESPAGLFIQSHKEYFSGWDLKFRDAYQNRGGFGASTAQFLGIYSLWLYREAPQQDMEKILDFRHLLEEYYKVAWNGEGFRPSGVDLVGQLKGSLTFVDKRQGVIAVRAWPFSNLEFFIVHTGHKVATHEHLKALKPFDSAGLLRAFNNIRLSMDKSDEGLFISGINSYAEELAELNFTCDSTRKLLDEVQGLEGVVAAKGCGALGADVILVVTLKGHRLALSEYLEHRRLSVLASSSDITSGLQIKGIV